MEKKYRILKGDLEDGKEQESLTLVGTKGSFKWDIGSEVTDLQLTEEDTELLISDGKIEVIEE